MSELDLDAEEFAPVYVVQLQLCDPCIDGEGDECHTPGCSLWLNRPPDIGLRDNPSVTITAQQPQSPPDSGTALYLSAIARLSAGLRDVQHACERGDAPHAVTPVAAAALADVDRLRLPQPAPELAVTASRLGYALAALREIAEPSDEAAHDIARNALDDDKAIREGSAVKAAPGLADPRLVALEPTELHKEVHELTEAHDNLLHAILPASSDPCDGDEDGDDLAVRYVRDLEAERDRLRLLVRDSEPLTVKPSDDVQPAPELAAAMGEAVKIRKVVRKLLDLFSAPDDRRMRHADVTARTLDRYADQAGIFATRLIETAGTEHIAAELGAESACEALDAQSLHDSPGSDVSARTPAQAQVMHLMTIEMGAWCGASGPGNGRASSQWREVTCPACTAEGMTWLRALALDMLGTMPASREALAFAVRAGRLGVTGPDGRPLVPACAGDDEDPWAEANAAGAE